MARILAGVLVLLHVASAEAASGTWTLDAAGNWSTASNWTGGIIADGADATASFTNDITASRVVTLSAARTVGGLTFADANIATAAGWTLSGAGPLTLQTSSGSPILSVGSLASGKWATVSVPLIQASSAGLTKTGAGGLILSGKISGPGTITLNDAGPLTLSGANTYTGGTQTTSAGTFLSVGNDLALGTGPVTLGDTVGSPQVWFQPAGTHTLANSFEIRTQRWIIDGNTINGNVAGSLTIAGNVYLNQSGAKDVYTNEPLTLAGTITSTGGLIKNGGSILTITGTASYAGATTVTAGQLFVDGSLTGSGAVGVASGSTLGGTGTIAGVVTMNGTSTISPGRPTTGTGTLTAGGLVLTSGSTVKLGLGDPSDAANGSFQVNGNLTLAGTLSVINTGALAAGNYPIFSYTGTLKNSGLTVALDPGYSGLLVFTTPGKVILQVVQAQALGPRNTEMISFADLTTLRWLTDPKATGYNVYFGTSAATVSAATPSTTGVYQGRSTTGTYTPTGLTAPTGSTTYYWRTDTVNANGSITAGPVWSFTVVNDRDVLADTWVATDALNRVLPTSVESGPPRPNQPIGIFYFLWHVTGSLGSDGPRDNSAYINGRNGYTTATNPWADGPPWMSGSNGRSWYWGQPEAGYYAADDEWVIRRHLALLSAAGVDVIAFDNTNGHPETYQANYTAIADTIRKMRAEGTKINLKFMFITHGGQGGSPATMTWLYDNFYRPGLYPELWYQWQGKPVIIGYPDGLNAGDGSVSDTVRNFFTIRAGWANGSNPVNEWQWIDTPTPQSVGYVTGRPDIAEQLPVAAGGWANGNLGRSNSNRKQPAFDNFHLSVNRTEGQGIFFSEQMFYGLKVDPQFLFVTGWNEWWAGAWDSAYNGYTNLLTMPVPAADRYFVDNYDAEYSRDIEPMKGGFGDDFYYQLVAQNRLRKGARPVPMASTAQTIAIGGDFSDWTTVGPEFLDVVGDVTARNHATTFSNLANYTNTTGRNDFRVLKVARDSQYLYFYAETVAPITAASGGNWMTLYIDADRSRATGWEGYDYVVNFGAIGASTTTLQRLTGPTWAPTVVRSDIPYKVSGNKLMLRVARADLGLSADPLTFDFHWADNYQTPGDISEFGVNGDSAPDRRFNYRYQTWTDSPVVLRQDGFESGQDPSWGETYASGSRWKISSTLPYSGNSCLLGTGSSSAAAPGVMINRTSTAGSTSLQVSFRYKLNNVADAQNIQVSYLNASNVWVSARELGRDEYYPTGQAWGYDERQNVWLLFNDTLTNSGSDAQFFHGNFAVKIDIAGLTSSTQTIAIDDFQINATQRLGVATASAAPNTAAGGAMSNNKRLAWTPGTGATTQNVYFGAPGHLQLVATVDGATGSFDPGTLQFGTNYAWRVDAINAYGTTVGQSWSFTTAVQPGITPAGFDSGQHFQLKIAGDVGPDYLIEGSEDMVNWRTLKTYSAAVPPLLFVDTDSNSVAKRFYRIRLGP